ncbi:MAG TPA: YhjD/YihY/BrkB family envelope integrity protein, partial [Polyangiaceae bacterium]|nr:YhjD/YihY/BrkB family envelope integrity protein [Polyangiaceae bacterium]
MLMPELIQTVRRAYRFFRRVAEEFARHRSALLAAALAYQTLICMSPLVIIAVAVAGIVFGRGAAHLELQRLLQDTLGPSGAQAIDEWVVQASREGELAGAVGLVLLILAASKLGKQLRHVLNQIWDVGADPLVPGFFAYLRRGLLAMATAAAAGPLLLLFLLSRSLLNLLHRYWFGSGDYWDRLSRGVEW